MARDFTSPNTGAIGRRRIVPMMGVDFIAGQIEIKSGPLRNRTTNAGITKTPYGVKPASIGGRTRSWSFINFLNVNSNKGWGNPKSASSEQLNQRSIFTASTSSAIKTVKNLMVLTQVIDDWANNTPRLGVYPNNYATLRGWVCAVRVAQGCMDKDMVEWPPSVNP